MLRKSCHSIIRFHSITIVRKRMHNQEMEFYSHIAILYSISQGKVLDPSEYSLCTYLPSSIVFSVLVPKAGQP